MLRYIIHRLLLMIPTLAGVAVLVFILLRMMPGDIVELKLLAEGGGVDEATIAMERARLGLDKSLWLQFWDWMKGLATGDLGISMWTGRPVIDEIASRLKNPDFGGPTQYPPELFANGSATGATEKQAWPVLPPLSMTTELIEAASPV